MKEKILIIGLIAVLLMPIASSAATMPQFEPVMPDTEKMSETSMNYMEEAQKAQMFGMLNYDGGGQYSGYFVEFTFDAANATIYDYTMKGSANRTIFSTVYIEKEGSDTIPAVHGAVFLFNDVDWYLQIHNNAPAVMAIEKTQTGTSDTEITYVLADGITAEQKNNGSILLNDGGHISLLLYGNNTADIENNTVTVNLKTGAVIFRGNMGNENNGVESAFEKSVQERHALGEIAVIGTGDERVQDMVPYQKNAGIMVKSMEQKRLELQISDTDSSGKILKISIGKASLGIDNAEKVRAVFDGEAAVREQSMDSLMLSLENGEKNAAYVVYENGEQMNVYAYIPHFSEHALTIEEGTTDSGSIAGLPMAALVLGGVALAAIVTGLVLLKRRK